MTLCGEASIVNPGPQHRRAVTLRCRSWQCDNCHDYRVRRLVAEIIQGRPERLLTLTVRAGTAEKPEAQARFIALSFRRLMQAIRRRWPEADHQYMAVFEAHKSGWPHLHVAMRGCYMDWNWLSDRWEKLTGSRGVDIRKIHNPKDCAAYVAKYMGKDSHRFGSCKRYWRSLGWPVDRPDPHEKDTRFGNQFWIVVSDIADLADDWSHRYAHVWWEATTLVTGPDLPTDMARFRRWIEKHAQ